ncbi:MAG: hypothetical protein EA391_05470 [Balneolaceae bacterium]|nr:MAG: hypothetical protein EA391_05470 [Balneolaceae bacterium]
MKNNSTKNRSKVLQDAILNLRSKARFNLFSKCRSENGATLVETLVALAILMSVLVPLIGLMAILAGNHPAREKVRALNYAQLTLERSIFQQAWTDTTFNPDPGWRITRTVTRDSVLVEIRVDVFRREDLTSIMHLSTVRLGYETEMSNHE